MKERGSESGLPEVVISGGMIFAISILAALTQNRFILAAGLLGIGIAGYLLRPRPKIRLVVYIAIVLVLTTIYVNGDRIWLVLRNLRH